jgi:putative YhbY family RNA-binding protein
LNIRVIDVFAHPRLAGLASAHFLAGLLQLSFAIASILKSLSPAERKLLKARAHALKPVVTIGDKCLSEAVLKEVETSLKAHDLIKIRVTGDDREARRALLGEICERTGASPVQHIGKILIVYRESQEQPAPPAKKRVTRKQPRRAKRSYQNT